MANGVFLIIGIVGAIIGAFYHNKFMSLSGRYADVIRQQRMLEMIIDQIKGTVYAKDVHGRFTLINKEWENLTGNRREDVIGKTDLELVPGELGEAFRAMDMKIIESRKPSDTEEEVEFGNRHKVLRTSKVPLIDGGKVIGMCGIGMDITEMVLMQNDLAEERDTLARTLDELGYKAKQLAQANEALIEEQVKSEKLLLNIFPKSVAEELKNCGATQSVSFDNVAVLFSDICDFTRISQDMQPAVLINELNQIFTDFDMIIERNRCERIKTIGDAYLAVSGMPDNDRFYSDHIVKSAVEIMCALRKRSENSEYKWKTKIGIHSGTVVGGVVGIKKYTYDIFGSTVNMASRLQNATKTYLVDIIISEDVYEQLSNKEAFHIRKIDMVRVKGDEHPIALYEVFDCDDEELKAGKLATKKSFNDARELYVRGEFSAALELFKVCHEICEADGMVSIYIKRCSTMLRMPVDENWTGISGI